MTRKYKHFDVFVGMLQMLIQSYVSLCVHLFSCWALGFTDSATVCVNQTKIQRWVVVVVVGVSLTISVLVCFPLHYHLLVFLPFSRAAVDIPPLLRLAKIKLKKETGIPDKHTEVPHPAGVINKSSEEEVNCCNRLIKQTPGDGEHF